MDISSSHSSSEPQSKITDVQFHVPWCQLFASTSFLIFFAILYFISENSTHSLIFISVGYVMYYLTLILTLCQGPASANNYTLFSLFSIPKGSSSIQQYSNTIKHPDKENREKRSLKIQMSISLTIKASGYLPRTVYYDGLNRVVEFDAEIVEVPSQDELEELMNDINKFGLVYVRTEFVISRQQLVESELFKKQILEMKEKIYMTMMKEKKRVLAQLGVEEDEVEVQPELISVQEISKEFEVANAELQVNTAYRIVFQEGEQVKLEQVFTDFCLLRLCLLHVVMVVLMVVGGALIGYVMTYLPSYGKSLRLKLGGKGEGKEQAHIINFEAVEENNSNFQIVMRN